MCKLPSSLPPARVEHKSGAARRGPVPRNCRNCRRRGESADEPREAISCAQVAEIRTNRSELNFQIYQIYQNMSKYDTNTWYQGLGTKYLVPSTWCPILGTEYLVSNSYYRRRHCYDFRRLSFMLTKEKLIKYKENDKGGVSPNKQS